MALLDFTYGRQDPALALNGCVLCRRTKRHGVKGVLVFMIVDSGCIQVRRICANLSRSLESMVGVDFKERGCRLEYRIERRTVC